MISGAVALKELRGASRRWTTYLLRFLFVAGALLVLWSSREELQDAAATSSEYAYAGRRIFSLFGSLQILGVLLTALAAGSDLLVAEAKAGTLALLTLTPLTLHRIVFGKWLAAFLQAGSLILCGAPALAMGAYLGGVDPAALALLLGYAVSFAMFGAALSIHASAVARSALRAFFGALAWFLLYYICLYAFLWALITGGVSSKVELQTILYLQAFLPVPLSFLFLLHAVRRVRRRLTRNERTAHLQRDEGFETSPGYYSKRLVVAGGVWERRPLLWKELATRATGRIGRGWRIAGFAAFALLFAWLAMASNGRDAGLLLTFGSFYVLAALAQGASLFAPENAGRRWDMLLTAPISTAAIVRAKIAAGLCSREALALLALFVAGLLACCRAAAPSNVLSVLLVAAAFLIFTYVLAAALSLHVKNARSAFLGGTAIIVALLILPPLLVTDNFMASGTFDRLWLSMQPGLLIDAALSIPYRYSHPVVLPFALFHFLLWEAVACLLLLTISLRLRRVAASM